MSVPLQTVWCKSSQRPRGRFGTPGLWFTVAFQDIFLWCIRFTGTGISSSVLLQNAWSWSSSAVEETLLQQLSLLVNAAHWLSFRITERNTAELSISCMFGVIWSHDSCFHCWSQVKQIYLRLCSHCWLWNTDHRTLITLPCLWRMRHIYQATDSYLQQ